MFGVACAFHEAAIRCKPTATLEGMVPARMAVNLAFACEVYLKSLLYMDSRNVRGHDPCALFIALAHSPQVEIARRYGI